jgi:serine/threonine-protein kinase
VLAAALVIGAVVLWNVLGVGDETDTPTDQPTRQRSSSQGTPSETPTQTPTQTPTPTPTEEPTTETVTVDEADYVGSDISDAEAALRELGLKVRKEKVDNPGDQTEGAVAAVDPTGTLDQGETVTVSYYDKVPPGLEVPLTPTDSASPQ